MVFETGEFMKIFFFIIFVLPGLKFFFIWSVFLGARMINFIGRTKGNKSPQKNQE